MFFEKTNKVDRSLARCVRKITEYRKGSKIMKCIYVADSYRSERDENIAKE